MLIVEGNFRIEDFGQALARERLARGDSVANVAKHTGGISQEDIRDYEAGRRLPDRTTVRRLAVQFPKLRPFEHVLRREQERPSVVIAAPTPRAKVKPAPPPKTRLSLVPQASRPAQRTQVERINQAAPATLTYTPLAAALRKTRTDMLSDLTRLATKRLGELSSDELDFTIKNDGKHLTIKLQVNEGDLDPETKERTLVFSGCYVTVGPCGAHGLEVFCKAMTGGKIGDTGARVRGAAELLRIAEVLHDAVKERTFD